MGRVSAPGVSDSFRSGFVIGLPPVMKFAQVTIPYFRNKLKRESPRKFWTAGKLSVWPFRTKMREVMWLV